MSRVGPKGPMMPPEPSALLTRPTERTPATAISSQRTGNAHTTRPPPFILAGQMIT